MRTISFERHQLGCAALLQQTRHRWPEPTRLLPDTPAQVPFSHMAAHTRRRFH